MKIAACGPAGEDVNRGRDDVVLRGNKKEVEWVRMGKRTKTKCGFDL